MSRQGKQKDQSQAGAGTPVDPREKVVHQWTFRLPPLGEMDGGWMYKSDNPDCPIDAFIVKQSIVPAMPAEVVITMTVIPADPPKTGEMAIASVDEAASHVIEHREVRLSSVARGPQADAYEPGYGPEP